ncbi:hypothetical protein AC249_AIPGENE28703 [Exaiptasia diaphana]|nr:hypothetical protein AC249_AIPGENE28703 [Exaiptasia diaphana]
MEQKIVDLSLERLQELATHLELVVDGDGKLKVLRHVRRKLEERIDSAEDKLSVVTDILEFIGTPNTEAAQVDEYAQAKDELQRMQDEFKKTLELQQKQIDEATAKLSSITQSKNVAEQETAMYPSPAGAQGGGAQGGVAQGGGTHDVHKAPYFQTQSTPPAYLA